MFYHCAFLHFDVHHKCHCFPKCGLILDQIREKIKKIKNDILALVTLFPRECHNLNCIINNIFIIIIIVEEIPSHKTSL